jgi:hypothetical protein
MAVFGYICRNKNTVAGKSALEFAKLCAVVLPFICNADVAFAQNATATGKDACSFHNPPELNDKDWGLTQIEDQFATLRDLGTIIPDLITDQRRA